MKATEEKFEIPQAVGQITRTERRGLADGVYVQGTVNGVPVTFTADTGASRTVVSNRVFDKIKLEEQPQLRHSACLVGAGGTPIREKGKAEFELTIGPIKLKQDAIVAEIVDDALLGYDMLVGSKAGPADILLSEDKIVLGGAVIQFSK